MSLCVGADNCIGSNKKQDSVTLINAHVFLEELVQLNSHYQEATEEASDKTRQLDTLELERRKLQQELYTSQERVSTLQETLTAEETEKKKVQGMLEATHKEEERWEEKDQETIINWAKKCMGL